MWPAHGPCLGSHLQAPVRHSRDGCVPTACAPRSTRMRTPWAPLRGAGIERRPPARVAEAVGSAASRAPAGGESSARSDRLTRRLGRGDAQAHEAARRRPPGGRRGGHGPGTRRVAGDGGRLCWVPPFRWPQRVVPLGTATGLLGAQPGRVRACEGIAGRFPPPGRTAAAGCRRRGR